MDQTPIAVELLPPERGTRSVIVGSGCCTCCCCCSCCAHVIGGLVGARFGTAEAAAVGARAGARSALRAHPAATRAIGAYWVAFSLATLIGGLLTLPPLGIVGPILVLFVLLPFVQLSSSLVTAGWVAFSGRAEDRGVALGAVRVITLWSFLGAVAGGFVNFLLFVGWVLIR